jgi:serine/threonine kinase PknH
MLSIAAARPLAITVFAALASFIGPVTAVAAPSPDLPPSDPQNVQQLMGVLSKGYGPDNCQSIPRDWPGQLAKVECQQNNDPNGPDWAMYALYGNPNDLRSDFKVASGANTPLPCTPGGDPKPHTWSYEKNSNQVAGWIACGSYNDNPEIVWTSDAKLTLGLIDGRDLANLHQWWLSNG